MRDRVVRAASDIGLGPEDIARLVRAYTAAMSVRESGPGALASDLDPDFLHPGRTVLILLDDVRERDVFVLAAGALAESRNAELRLSPDAAEEILGDAAGLWRALPSVEWNRVSEAAVPQGGQDAGDTDDERILEELVSAPLAVQRKQMRHWSLMRIECCPRRSLPSASRLLPGR